MLIAIATEQTDLLHSSTLLNHQWLKNPKLSFSSLSYVSPSYGTTLPYYHNTLLSDVKNIGSTYTCIGKLFEEQAKIDWQPLFDKLYIYKGITSNLPNILQMQKMAEQKKKDCERNNQMSQLALTEVRRRSDVITYTVFAELNNFQQERDQDMKRALKDFLQEQLNFYKNVVAKIEETLNQFE